MILLEDIFKDLPNYKRKIDRFELFWSRIDRMSLLLFGPLYSAVPFAAGIADIKCQELNYVRKHHLNDDKASTTTCFRKEVAKALS